MIRLLLFFIPLILLTSCLISETSGPSKSSCGDGDQNNPNCSSDEKYDDDEKHDDDDEKHDDDDEKQQTASGADRDKSNPFTWEYLGLTHAPVNFTELMSETSRCADYLPIQPYFNHFIVSHTEGPKKWYLATCSNDPFKVFMPATVIVHKMGGINFDGQSQEDSADTSASFYDGNEIIYDTQIWGQASENVTIFFMHLALLNSIYSALNNSEEHFIVIEAGTHIGYIKNHESYEMEHQVIDFGVEDKEFDAGLTTSESWWNHRVNPLDYFSDDIQNSLRASYQAIYPELVEDGTHPFTDLEDSRANLNSDGEIWGTWFKADSEGGLSYAPAWSVIHLTKTQDLSLETYWKTLESNPGLSGILLESKRAPLVGKGLYSGPPAGKNKIFIESGQFSAGVAKVSPYYSQPSDTNETTLYWKYSVDAKSVGTFDDTLTIETFTNEKDATNSGFSENAAVFQRQPN